jgi:hypothetical protein
MSLHTDTLFWFRAKQALLLLLIDACLAEKQQIPILKSLVWPVRGSNPQSTALEGEHANHYTTDAVLVSSNFIQQSGTTNVKTKSCISDTFEVTSVVMSTPICIQDDLHLSVYRTTSVNDYYNDYYLNLPRMSTLGYYHELFVNIGIGLGLCRFTPRSTIFQLFGNDQFYWWRKPT